MSGRPGGKRKHGDPSYSGDGYSRPSPHRPEDLDLARQSNSPSGGRQSSYNEGRSRGRDRGSRRGNSRGNPYNHRGGRHDAGLDPAASPFEPAPVPAPTAAEPTEKMVANDTADEVMNEAVDEPLLSVPFEYTLITDEICAQIQEQDVQAAIALLTLSQGDEDDTQVSLAIQELIQSVLSGRIEPQVAGQLIGGVPVQDNDADEAVDAGQDVQNMVIDAVSVAYEDNESLPFSCIAQFLSATQIPADMLRHHLDPKLLEKVGMIRSTFDRMAIRKQTNIVYRQANFNLVREESEGFAKLMTEVFSCCTSQEPSGTNAADAVEKVKALIGAFDLDVGRSLDVVLDVFGSVLVGSFRFFVKFLRASPWWPSGTETGSQNIVQPGLPLWALPGVEEWKLTEEQKAQRAFENLSRDTEFWSVAKEQGLRAFYHLGLRKLYDNAQTAADDDFSKAWVEETGTVPPLGNKNAAQFLGFKLRFYSQSAARDESDALQDNLIFLSALLIKIGFISLKDLFPHLWRPDEAMEALKAQKQKEKEERESAARPGAGARNALLMAGALPDDTAPTAVPKRLHESSTRAGTPSKDSEADKSTSKDSADEPADQKIALLKALLAIGALPEALFIIGRFPWVLNLIPDLPEYLFRILKHCLSSVAAQSQPLVDLATLQEPLPLYETDIPGLAKGQVRLESNQKPKELRWAHLDRQDHTDGKSYRFYFDEWNDQLPVCQTVDDVFVLFDTLLPLVDVKIGQDPDLVTRIARIGKYSLKQDTSDSNRDRWLDFAKRILLPSISLTKANAGVVNEVFELLVYFPTKTRYLLYLEWRDGRTSRNPDVKAATDQARAETRDILKRISKTNARQMARALARVAYANPHIVTTVALNQIESYDSISAVFVEGSRYFTDLGYDVLTWNLIFSLAKAGRNNTQDGGIFASKWLTALSRFAGDIYKKYNMMKPGPILQYVVRQLELGNTMELKMLENIVTSMAGITNDTTYNESQLQAMGGGSLLQSQTILQLLDGRHEKQTTSKRLIASLQTNNLTGKFLISMAQQRQACLVKKDDAPLKVIGNTYDEIHRVLSQYLDLLQHGLGLKVFADAIPDVVTLMVAYEIRPEIAFMICRSIISKKIIEYEREKAEDASQAAPADVEMKDDESSEEDGEAEEDEPVEVNAATPSETEINAVADTDPIDGVLQINGEQQPWHPVLQNIMDDLQDNLPEEILSTIGTGFYVTFWQLSLYDIAVPRKSYQDEIARQKKKRDAAKLERVVGQSATRRKEDQIQSLTKLIDDLLSENGQHVKAQIACRRRLNAEKQVWFLGQARANEKLNTALWEHCFLPRILASPLDAYFSFSFVKFLHTLGTPNFRTLGFYDLLFRKERLTSLIFLSSSKEAEHFGRFLGELLKDLNRWHKSKTVYEKETWGSKKELPGFATKVEAGKPVAFLAFDSFRKLLFKWHTFLHQAFQQCLKSTEYMHVRNAISVLHVISEGATYPVINVHGVSLQTTIDKLRKSEMQDLVTASTSLLSALKRGEKQWISSAMFGPGIAKESTPMPAEKKSETPAPQVKKEDEAPNKGAQATDTASKAGSVKDSKDDAKVDVSSRLPARSGPVNGVASSDRDERSSSRQGRPDSSRAPLPRKISPPPRHTPPANLPSRPDPMDSRASHRDRDLPRSTRPPQDVTRPPQPRDARDPRDLRDPRDVRDPRASYRRTETHYDDYERLPRRYDPPDGRPSSSRDDRGYPRDRDPARTHDRPRDADRDRDKGSDRDRPPSRPHSRERDARERPLRETAARHAADDSASRQLSRGPARSDSAQPQSQTGPVSVNPQRAAQIGLEAAPSATPPHGPPSRSDRGPRPSSPRRDAERRPDPRDRFRADLERQDGDRRPDIPSSRHGPPSSMSQPRSDHPSRSQRDSRAPQGPGNIDMDAGRLERDPSHRPPPRGEAAAEPDIPSGPRGAAGSMGAPRTRAMPASINTRSSQQTPATERQAPTGPSGRHSRAPSASENNSAPPTPDTSGVHPSRLGQVASPVEPPRAAQPPPAGPRGRGAGPAQQPPQGSAAPSRGPPPSGPASADPMGRGARPSRNQMSAVNDTLAQAAHPGASVRGRGGARSASNNYPPHSGAPSGPAPTSSAGPERGPPRGDAYGQNDLFATHSDPNHTPIGTRPPSTRQDSMRDRRGPPTGDRPDDARRSTRRHDDPRDRDQHDSRGRDHRERGDGDRDRDPRGAGDAGKPPTDRRDGPPPPRHEDRSTRRNDGPGGSGAYADSNNDPRGGPPGGPGGRGDYRSSRGPPRGSGADFNGNDSGGSGGPPPTGPGGLSGRKHPRSDENGPGAGQYPGGGGRGGGRIASESKRPRRGG